MATGEVSQASSPTSPIPEANACLPHGQACTYRWGGDAEGRRPGVTLARMERERTENDTKSGLCKISLLFPILKAGIYGREGEMCDLWLE